MTSLVRQFAATFLAGACFVGMNAAMTNAQPKDSPARKTLERSDWRHLPGDQLKELVVATALTYGLQPGNEQRWCPA